MMAGFTVGTKFLTIPFWFYYGHFGLTKTFQKIKLKLP